MISLGEEVGLDTTRVQKVLERNLFAAEVRADVDEGYELGVPGVPFFVFGRKYAISGAQAEETFVKVMEKMIKSSES